MDNQRRIAKTMIRLKKSSLLTFLISLFITFLTSVTSASYNSMPRTAMYIGGIGSGCTLGYVRSVYGEPADKEQFSGEGLDVVTFIYSDTFRVTARTSSRNPVDEDDMIVSGFICTDETLKTPFGVGVGMPFTMVSDKFGPGRKGTGKQGEYHYYTAGAVEMDFYVDESGIITQIYQGTDF